MLSLSVQKSLPRSLDGSDVLWPMLSMLAWLSACSVGDAVGVQTKSFAPPALQRGVVDDLRAYVAFLAAFDKQEEAKTRQDGARRGSAQELCPKTALLAANAAAEAPKGMRLAWSENAQGVRRVVGAIGYGPIQPDEAAGMSLASWNTFVGGFSCLQRGEEGEATYGERVYGAAHRHYLEAQSLTGVHGFCALKGFGAGTQLMHDLAGLRALHERPLALWSSKAAVGFYQTCLPHCVNTRVLRMRGGRARRVFYFPRVHDMPLHCLSPRRYQRQLR